MDSGRPLDDADELLAHTRWLRALARSLVLDDARADDVVQETWLAALRAGDRPIEHRRAWLGGVLRRVVGHQVRGERRRRGREQHVARGRPELQAMGAAELVAEAEWQRTLVDAVLALREPYRATLLAVDLGGRTPAEVARDQGTTAATVRSRRARALAMLRARLDAESEGRGVWLAPLASLGMRAARPHGATAAAGATSMSLAAGALIISSKSMVQVLVVLAILAGGAWWLTGTDDAPAAPAIPPVRGPDVAVSEPVDAVVLTSEVVPPEELALPHDADGLHGVGQPVRFTGRVVDTLGAPVAQARVRLLPDGWTLQALGFDPYFGASRVHLRARPFDHAADPWARFPEVRSDAFGRFDLSARLEPWGQPAWDESQHRLPELVVRAAGFSTHFEVVLAQADSLLALGDLVLQPGVQVRGRVLDDTGEPVRDAVVSAHARMGLEPTASGQHHGVVGDDFRTVRTDGAGEYALAGLRVGAWRLRFSSEQHLVHELQSVELSAAGDHELADVVLESGGELRGRVVDAAGNALAGAEVFASVSTRSADELVAAMGAMAPAAWFEYELSELRVGALPDGVHRTTTGDGLRMGRSTVDGSFALGGLRGPTFELWAAAPGHDPGHLLGVAVDTRDVALELQPRGTLFVEVFDDEGAPLADVHVAAVGALGDWFSPGQGIELPVTREDGGHVFAVGDVGAAPVVVRVGVAGRTPVLFELPGLPAGVREGRRTVAVPRHEARVSGMVVDDLGRPLAGARVSVSRMDRGVYELAGFVTEVSASCDDAGRFVLEGLGPGEVWIVASHDGHLASWGDGSLQLAPDGDVVVMRTLERAGLLTGRALDGDGRPWSGRSVSVWLVEDGRAERSSGFYGQTNGAGLFSTTALRPGEYRVEIENLGVFDATVKVGETTHLECSPEGAPLLRGRVTQGGFPAAGVDVLLSYVREQDARELPASTVTDAAGAFEIALTVDLAMRLRARSASGSEGPVVELPRGYDTTQPVELELFRGRLVGSVVSASTAEPVGGATLRMSQGIVGRSLPEAVTDEFGRFEFVGVAAQASTVWVRADGHVTQRVDALPVDDGVLAEPLRIALETGAAIVCRLFDEDGRPSERRWVIARVYQLDDDGASGFVPKGAWSSGVENGLVRLDGLAPGVTRVLFFDSGAGLQHSYEDQRRDALAELAVELVAGDVLQRDVQLPAEQS